MSLFKGLGVAMVTPFSEDGSINYKESERLIEFLISNGNDALIALGTTGEAATISPDERRDFIKFVIRQTNKRVPVIVGTGSNNTVVASQLSIEAQELGADGLLIVTPYYNKCTQNGLVAHYKYISDRVTIPIIVYNVPGRTGVNILPKTAISISKIKNIVGIKEAAGNVEQLQELMRLKDDSFDVYTGDDALTAVCMILGGAGVISVASNTAPKEMSEITTNCLSGNIQKAVQAQLKLLPLISALFCEVNPIPVKKALQLIGIDVGTPRLPLTEMEEKNATYLEETLKELKII